MTAGRKRRNWRRCRKHSVSWMLWNPRSRNRMHRRKMIFLILIRKLCAKIWKREES